MVKDGGSMKGTTTIEYRVEEDEYLRGGGWVTSYLLLSEDHHCAVWSHGLLSSIPFPTPLHLPCCDTYHDWWLR